MMSYPYAIQTDHLTRDFKTLRAVNQLSIEVATGIVFGFLGPNGSGKTTTIRLLLGLLEPTEGNASVLGFNVRTQSNQIRTYCGTLLEHHGLYERLSAIDNLEFYGRAWHIPNKERKERIHSLFQRLELWDRRDEIVMEWSRGMKQKLAVGRALLHNPRLVFLDEPTAGLDPIAAAALRDNLASLAAQEGVTVFLTTHNLSEAEKLCQQVAVIRQGKLLAVGTPAELQQRSRSLRVEIRGSGFSDALISQLIQRAGISSALMRNGSLVVILAQEIATAPLVSFLVSAGVQVEEVRRDQASLEEVFLTLMEEEQ